MTSDTINITGMKKGDTFTAYGKTFAFIGTNGNDAFFVKPRGKFAHYCKNYNGTIRVLDMTRMDATAKEIEAMLA